MEKNKYRPTICSIFMLSIAIAIICLMPACQPTEECGTFAFSGDTTTAYNMNALNMQLSFSFNSATCGKQCIFNQDCFIQMVHVYSIEDNTYEYAASYEQDRADSNGWFVDRLDGNIWGYFGLQNDGTFGENCNTPGYNTTPTILYDEPGRPDTTLNFLWEAVDVPVTINSPSCNNHILGYYFWSWSVDANGVPHKFANLNALKNLDTEFQDALNGWNAWAPGMGAKTFPSLTDL
jgi:hypothetical protein